jgi:hypothetical protein
MKNTLGYLHCLHALILEMVATGAIWWCVPVRQVKSWALLFLTHKTWSRRDWKKKVPSFETSSFMDQEHDAICPLSTFSHGML